MMIAPELTGKNKPLLTHPRVLGGPILLFLFTVSGITAEVRREQFSKAELDYKGYPTNVVMAAELGRAEARRDLSNGIVRIPVYGMPTIELIRSADVLKERYHVQMHPLAACVVTGGLVAYADGYSEVSCAFIEAKHGTGMWTMIRSRAENASVERLKLSTLRAVKTGEYRVRTGDTFDRIASEHSVTLKALIEANPNLDPAKLRIGQTVQIPANNER